MVTKIVGILNITTDSFFDGGKYTNAEAALQYMHSMIKDGAAVIDVGAESTRPGANPVSAEEEMERLKEVLPLVISEVKKYNQENQANIEVSIDSRNSKTIAKALELGVDIINDVSGCDDEEVIKLAAQSGKKIIVMHSLSVPPVKDQFIDENLDVLQVLIDWMTLKLDQLLKAGVKREQIIFDVGVGYGKSAKQMSRIFQEIDRLKVLNLPLFFGHSYKSFLDGMEINGYHSRSKKTIAVSGYLTSKDIDYIRVHEVLYNKEYLYYQAIF